MRTKEEIIQSLQKTYLVSLADPMMVSIDELRQAMEEYAASRVAPVLSDVTREDLETLINELEYDLDVAKPKKSDVKKAVKILHGVHRVMFG